MSKVKGGKLESFDIQASNPMKIWVIRLIYIAVLLVASACTFYLGYFKGDTDRLQAQKNIDALAEEILVSTSKYAQLNEQYTKLQEQYAHLELSAQIDASQVERFRLANVEHIESMNELKLHLAFYQSIMSPSDMKQGLTIEQLEIVEGGQIKAMLTQITDKPLKIVGTFQVLVTGLLNDKTKVYNLSDISSRSDNVRFGFKFFQRFSIDLTLPEGFVPQSVELIAKKSGNNQSINKTISWPSAN